MVFAYRNTSPERHVYNGNNTVTYWNFRNFDRQTFRNDTVFHPNLRKAFMHFVIEMRCGGMETRSTEDEFSTFARVVFHGLHQE